LDLNDLFREVEVDGSCGLFSQTLLHACNTLHTGMQNGTTTG
jgi:hypothetical protein